MVNFSAKNEYIEAMIDSDILGLLKGIFAESNILSTLIAASDILYNISIESKDYEYLAKEGKLMESFSNFLINMKLNNKSMSRPFDNFLCMIEPSKVEESNPYGDDVVDTVYDNSDMIQLQKVLINYID